MKLTHFILTNTAALALAATTATAATVTWGPATNISADTNVSTTGTLVAAYNVGTVTGFLGAATSTTINGVTFNPFAIPPSAPSVTMGNFTLATAATNGLNGDFAGAPSPAAPFSNLPASYQSLLLSAGAPINGGFLMTLTMSGLAVGQSYAFQWWANDSDRELATGATTASAGNFITLDVNTGSGGLSGIGGVGQFALGTFTADATGSQSITFNSPLNTVPKLNGFQLRQTSSPVPEPGTALFGLALCGTALTRRTRRLRC